MNIRRTIVITSVLAAPASLALASNQAGTTPDQWKEANSGGTFTSGGFYADAGEALATANFTAGAGPLNTISGRQLYTNADADLYRITITDPAAFSATVNTGVSHADLYLFKADGTAVAGYQYYGVGPAPAVLAAGVAAGAFSAGDIAFIAITRDSSATFYNHPLNASGAQIFPLTAGAVLPDPSVPDHVLGTSEGAGFNWSDLNAPGEPQSFGQTYTITLTGAGYSQLPAPGAGVLMGLGGAMVLRRRRN